MDKSNTTIIEYTRFQNSATGAWHLAAYFAQLKKETNQWKISFYIVNDSIELLSSPHLIKKQPWNCRIVAYISCQSSAESPILPTEEQCELAIAKATLNLQRAQMATMLGYNKTV